MFCAKSQYLRDIEKHIMVERFGICGTCGLTGHERSMEYQL